MFCVLALRPVFGRHEIIMERFLANTSVECGMDTYRTFGWNALNICFVAFIFFAPFYPMPTLSALGFVSPALTAILLSLVVFNLLTFQPALYVNRYVKKMLVVYVLLLLSDVLCLLFFKPSQQLSYLAGRMVMVVIFLAGLSFKPNIRSIQKFVWIYCLSISFLSVLTILEGVGLIHLGTNVHVPRTFFGVTIPFLKATGVDMSDGEFGIMTAPAFFYCAIHALRLGGAVRIRGTMLMTVLIGIALLILWQPIMTN